MNKIRANLSMSQEALEQVTELASLDHRSVSNMIEKLILDAYARL